MSQPDWPARLARVIAGEVRRYRSERKMSAQQLADRCADLGMEIPRAVLANLENGRRPLVTVAELLVLAAALDVPPVMLVAPLGRRQATEVLPDRHIPTWDAVLWHSGETRLSDEPHTVWLEWAEGVVPLYHRHDRLLEDLTSGIWLAAAAGNDDQIDERATAEIQHRLRRDLEDDLRQVRARMRELGLTALPELPPDLAYIDQPRPPARRG